jgi:hypothetical protein
MSQSKVPTSIAIVLGGLILLSLVLSLNLNPTADITWRLHIARETLAGKEIYRDLIETNPPLWFWASLGWAKVAAALNISAYAVMCVGIHALAVIALFALNRLTAQTLNLWQRCALLLGFVVAYLFVTIGEIGQREQGLLVGAVLWLALANMRLEGRAVPAWLVILVTLFAAYGFALKHYFVAIPILTEIWLLVALGRAYRPIRLETLLLGGAAIIYAAAVFYFAPLFLSRIVPLVLIAYSSFGSMMGFTFEHRLYRIALDSFYLIIPFFLFVLSKDRPKLVTGLLLVMITTAIIVVLQLKGWRYHRLAPQGTAFMLLALLLGTALGRGPLRNIREIAAAVACLVGTAYVFIAAPLIDIITYQGQVVSRPLRQLVFSEAQDKRIAILSLGPEHAFYLLDRAGRPQWSRHYGMWMLPGLQTAVPGAKTEGKRIEELNRVRREFIADLTCIPPDIIVSERGWMRVKTVIPIDTLGYLKQDATFASWFDAAYKPAESFHIFTVWRLKGPKPAAGPCPRDP